MQRVYKILTADEAAAIEGLDHWAGSALDQRDGFVHLSSAAQLAETVSLHFGAQRLLVLGFDADALDLTWEPSRGGTLFPHLYAPLPVADATGRTWLPAERDGIPTMEPELTYRSGAVADPEALFAHVRDAVAWTAQMASRKTASLGRPYNYKGASYPVAEWLPALAELRDALAPEIGFEATNCLLNYYPTGRHSLGWHQDDVDILAPGTGIAIISLGAPRPLRLRRVDPLAPNGFEYRSVTLEPGSLLMMTAAMQATWQHSLRRVAAPDPRISLTFREIVRWRTDGGIA
ncbi:MAG: hypothetical protein ACI9U2_001502 [Bradymonadia bacterium]|jgi:uncharacterized protein (DUF952 family)/alkylated DNA repair dioxygenase AlkB